MFSRGTRFPAEKPSEVPGPNAYDIQDPEYDNYKKGAMLEKQDRFNKPSDVPGPGTYNVDGKHGDGRRGTTVERCTSNDRYAVLQAKLEDLERVHAETKRLHQADLDRLKVDLALAQKLNSDGNDQLEKLRKQNDAKDAKIRDLTKGALADQSEIKDIRTKLRLSENERVRLASKQGEASEAKKALQAAEAKRKEEMREKDRKIAELDRVLAVEKKMRDTAEARYAEVNGKVGAEVQDARSIARLLEQELKHKKAEVDEIRSVLAAVRLEAAHVEEDLLAQLENHRVMLSRVAVEYGRLASTTVAKADYERMKKNSLSLQLESNHLERKSANAEAQVTQLAEMVRHLKDQNTILASHLRQAEEQLSVYSAALVSAHADGHGHTAIDDTLAYLLYMAAQDLRESSAAIQCAVQADNELWDQLASLRRRELLLHASSLIHHVENTRNEIAERSKELDMAKRQVKSLTAEKSTSATEIDSIKAQLVEAHAALAVSHATEESLRKQIENVRAEKSAEVARIAATLKQEKEANSRLAGVVQLGKAAEEALNAEIDRLTADLAEAEQYREAYCNMVDDVDALVRRNALAEDEAKKLSKFNAEILGHKNPAQRIMYVDKIRQELHDTKHALLLTNKEKEAVMGDNEALREELAMYKSVATPSQSKPRTFVTRVTRGPLTNQNLNPQVASIAPMKHGARLKTVDGARRQEANMDFGDGNMTVDELSGP